MTLCPCPRILTHSPGSQECNLASNRQHFQAASGPPPPHSVWVLPFVSQVVLTHGLLGLWGGAPKTTACRKGLAQKQLLVKTGGCLFSGKGLCVALTPGPYLQRTAQLLRGVSALCTCVGHHRTSWPRVRCSLPQAFHIMT